MNEKTGGGEREKVRSLKEKRRCNERERRGVLRRKREGGKRKGGEFE